MSALDLGRPLTSSDIVDEFTFPIDSDDTRGYRCFECGAEPLSASTGVFTARVLCSMHAPVYLCLECIPFFRHEFEAFSPEVAATLMEKQKQRRIQSVVEN